MQVEKGTRNKEKEESSAIEHDRGTEKINKTSILLFKKRNEIDKPLARQILGEKR